MTFGRHVVSWLAITTTVSLGLFAAMGTQGCTVTTGTPDDDGGFPNFDSATPDTSPPVDSSTQPTPCYDCLFGHCSGQYAVCVQDSECQQIYSCAIACPVTDVCGTCVQACYDNGTERGRQIYNAFAICDATWAASDCSASCGPSSQPPDSCKDAGSGVDASQPDAAQPDAAPVDAGSSATCDQCIADNCSAQKSACPAGSECDLYTQCVGACNSADCLTTCTTQHQSGATAAAALATCTTTNCKTQCGY